MTRSRSNIFLLNFHDIFMTFSGLINRNIVPTPPYYDTQPNYAIFDLKIDISVFFFVLEPKLEN